MGEPEEPGSVRPLPGVNVTCHSEPATQEVPPAGFGREPPLPFLVPNAMRLYAPSGWEMLIADVPSVKKFASQPSHQSPPGRLEVRPISVQSVVTSRARSVDPSVCGNVFS